MIYVSILLSLLYAALMLWLLYGIKKLPKTSDDFKSPEISFSICIPYRNEAENLPGLLQSIANLNYPKDRFEVLLINDNSKDASETIVQEFKEKYQLNNCVLLQSSAEKSGKKQALNLGITKAKHNYILQTDADCILPQNWLQYYNSGFLREPVKLLAGPVKYATPSSFFEHFQHLDFLSLQAATFGGFGNKKPFLLNAANMGFEKSAFVEVNGYQDNEDIASGDDIFLLEKMQKNKQPIGYLFNMKAAVKTQAPQSWKALFWQRVRWASKTSAYQNFLPKSIGILIFAVHLFLVLSFFGAIFFLTEPITFLLLFFIKLNLDFIVLYTAGKFYEQENSLRKFIGVAALHPFFNTVVSVKALFGGYTWKERNFKK